MAERNVQVRLSVQMQDFKKGMEEARKVTEETGSAAEQLAQKKQDFDLLGSSAFAMGGVMAAGIGLAISRFAEFDESMSAVQAATHESEANMGLLRDAALEAGATTVFSATEAANAIEELSKAGLSTADILGGALAGSMSLAAAGGLGVAEAAEISATALKQFELGGEQATHVSDLLAAGAGKAMGSVQDLANGLKFVGPVANAMGVSLEETVGVMALFAQQGIIGEQAGTSLRGVLSSLTAPSAQARKEIERLGLTMYDSEGNFLGLETAAGELAGAYRGMDGASRDASMGIIFGRETITAATALYKAGSEGVEEWTTAVDDSGYAAETAAARLDNLKGDMEALGGATDTLLIKMGEGANGPFRFFVQALTDVVEGFGNMPDGTQQAALAIGAVVSAASLGAGAFFTFTPKVAEFNAAIDGMGPKAQKGAKAIGALSKGLGAAAGFGAAVVVLDKLANSSDKVAASLEETTGALLENDLGSLFQGLGSDVDSFASGMELLSGSSINSGIERFGSTLNGIFFGGSLSDQVADTREQFDAVGKSLATLVNSGEGARAEVMFEKLAAAAKEQGYSQEDLLELLPAYSDALKGVSNEQQIAGGTAEEQAEALAQLEGRAEGASESVDKLAETIRGFGEANFDLRDAQREVEAALDDFEAAMAENGSTLDITTEAGRANQAALDDVAQSYLEAAAAAVTQTNSAEAATPVITKGREEFIRLATALGKSSDEANALADELGLIPGDVTTAYSVSGADNAIARANAVRVAVEAAVAATNALSSMGPRSRDGGGEFADGGGIYGPGGPRSDNIPIWVSPGEHILDAEDVRAMGGQEAVYRFRAGLGRGFADGGAVVGSAPMVSPIVSLAGANFTVTDSDGTFLGRMQVVADNRIAVADHRSSREMRQGFTKTQRV